MDAQLKAVLKKLGIDPQSLQTKGRKTKGKKSGRRPFTDAEKEVFKAQNDAACIAAFTKAGYKDVRPRENVLVYGRIKEDGSVNGWLAKGRRVRPGEKAIRVGPFALFHEDQTDPIAQVTATQNAETTVTIQ